MADYIDRTKLKEDSEYNPVSGEYLSYSRGQIWNAHSEKVIDISVLDKIRAGIEQLPTSTCTETYRMSIDAVDFKENVLAIIGKYRAKSEG